jgi:hypothetical protein
MFNSLATSLEEMDIDSEARATTELKATIQDLLDRCRSLHYEVETYVAAVEANQKLAKLSNPVEYRSLRNDFKHELAFLNKLVGTKLSEEKARNYIVSSNLLYYEALWSAAKRSSGLLAFRKYFFWNRRKEGGPSQGLGLAKGSQTKGKSSALVDIVAMDGLEWVRVSTTSEKRLLFDLAKMGWHQNDSDSDDEMADTTSISWEDEDDEDQVDIVKNARELARAARANPIRGHPPRVHFVLTRVELGKTKEVDAVIQKIRDTGAIVQCANDIPDPPSLQEALPNLLVDRSRTLSDIINIDCTILLALISDISHTQCPILDWYPGEVRAQIKEEETEKLLATHLYPTIGSHQMVCTREAAEQMNQIVDTLATDTEKERAKLLLAQGDYEGSAPQALLRAWDAMSDHTIPEGFKLPIKVVSSSLENSIGKSSRNIPAKP